MALERNQFISDDALQAPLELSRNLEQVTKSLKEIIAIAAQSSKALGTGNATQQKTREVVDELAKANERLKKANSDVAKEIAKVNIQTQERNKQVKQEARASLGLVGAYDKLTSELNAARKAYKDLAASGTASTKALKDQATVVNQLDSKIKAIDKTAGQFQRNNYPKTFLTAANAVKSFVAAFGIVGGVQLLATTIKDVIQTYRDFTKENSILASVLGVTSRETEVLTAQQRALGASTQFTAVEVAQAQIELAKLGFTIQEINQATPAILNAATALETDLASAAELVAGQINAFQLTAGDATKVVDTLSQAANIGAFDFEKLATSLGNVAPAANAVGATMQETLAILSAAIDANIDASTAGASLRNIFIDLSATGISWKEAMDKIQGSTDKLSVANELFGKRGALVATVIAANSDKIIENTDKLNENGVAARIAAEKLNNLDGDITLLNSAWTDLTLNLTTGESLFGDVARSVVQATTALLQFVQTNQTLINYIKFLFTPLRLLIRGFELLSDIFDEINTSAGPGVISFFGTLTDAFKNFIFILANIPNYLTGFLYAATETFSVIGDAAKDTFTYVKDLIIATFDPTKSIGDVINKAVNTVEGYGARIAKAYNDGFNKYMSQQKAVTPLGGTIEGSNKKGSLANFDPEGGSDKKKKVKDTTKQEIDARLSALQRIQDAATKSFADELESFKKHKEEQAKFDANFNDRLKSDSELRAEQEKAILDKQLQAYKEHEEKKRAIEQASLDLGYTVFAGILDARQTKLDDELSLNQARREAELEAAGDDERRKLAINKKFDREQAKIKARQARTHKLQALFDIAINTAVGITSALRSVPPNPVLAAIIAATGAAQAILVAARPVPAFWKGSESTPDTFIAGDRGRELVVHKGQAMLTPDKATMFSGMEGAVVLPHPRTEEILGSIEDADISRSILRTARTQQSVSWNRIERQLDENNNLLRQIASRPVEDFVIDEKGFYRRTRKGLNKLDNYYKRFGEWK